MLRAENLVKRFEDKTALDGLNTEIRRGDAYMDWWGPTAAENPR